MAVSGSQATDDTCSCDCGVDDRDDVRELGFEDRVEVGAGGQSCEAVAGVSWDVWDARVGEFGEDSDVGRVLKLAAYELDQKWEGNSRTAMVECAVLVFGGLVVLV